MQWPSKNFRKGSSSHLAPRHRVARIFPETCPPGIPSPHHPDAPQMPRRHPQVPSRTDPKPRQDLPGSPNDRFKITLDLPRAPTKHDRRIGDAILYYLRIVITMHRDDDWGRLSTAQSNAIAAMRWHLACRSRALHLRPHAIPDKIQACKLCHGQVANW